MSDYQRDLALEQSQYDAIVNGIAAAQSDAENAQLRLQQAWSVNDLNAAAEEQRRLSRAEARLVQLENGKDAWDERQTQAGGGAVQPQQQQTQQTPEQIINSMPLMPAEREWLMQRQHLVMDPNRVLELQGAYAASQREGLRRGSQEYLNFIGERTGTTSVHGLTKAQQDHARWSGVEESEYAKQVRKMYELKHNSDALYGSLGRR